MSGKIEAKLTSEASYATDDQHSRPRNVHRAWIALL